MRPRRHSTFRYHARRVLQEQVKISHHRHSGRLQPHEHTSYFSLAVLLLVVGFVLTVSTVSASPDPPPQAGSIGLSGVMPATPPKAAADITSPTSQKHFSTTPITVQGTCPVNTLVELYKNNIFAGSTPCNPGDTFNLQIDLLIGQNILIARDYDALNQAGPDSAPVTVYYDALPPQSAALSSLNLLSSQLILNTDAVFRGTFPNQPLSLPIGIVGGTPPYAINIHWGDTAAQIVPRSNNETFTAEHTYTRAGTFQITLQGTDAQGRIAFLTVAAIINGQPATIASSSAGTTGSPNLMPILWPIFAVGATVVASFWLGEQREKRLLVSPQLTLHTHP